MTKVVKPLAAETLRPVTAALPENVLPSKPETGLLAWKSTVASKPVVMAMARTPAGALNSALRRILPSESLENCSSWAESHGLPFCVKPSQL